MSTEHWILGQMKSDFMAHCNSFVHMLMDPCSLQQAGFSVEEPAALQKQQLADAGKAALDILSEDDAAHINGSLAMFFCKREVCSWLAVLQLVTLCHRSPAR